MRPIRVSFLLLVVVSSLAVSATATERPVSGVRVGISSTSSSGPEPFGSWNGERFLVAWGSTNRGGQAMLLDAAGQPVFATAIGLPVQPAAMFWREDAWYVLGSGRSFFGWVRVSADGALLDAQPQALEGLSGFFGGAVWTGEVLILVTESSDPVTNGTRSTVATVFGADLQRRETYVLGKEGGVVCTAADAGTALVAFFENRGKSMKAALFRRDGYLLREREIDGAPSAWACGSAGDGTGYFFISSRRTGQPGRLTSYHLNHNLAPRHNAPSFAPEKTIRGSEDLVWDGSAYTFFYGTSWPALDDIRMARLAPDGTLLEDASIVRPVGLADWAGSAINGVAGMGTSLLLYRRADQPGAADAFLRLRAGHDATTIAAAGELNLERSAFAQTDPVAASSNTQSLLVWREQTSHAAPTALFATRVLHGEVRDPQSLFLGALANEQQEASLASNGDSFVVAWHGPRDVIARHVAADGTMGPEVAIARLNPGAPAGALAVLSNGSGYLVAWSDETGGRDRGFAVRLRADGSVEDAVPIQLGWVDGSFAGAGSASGYFLAWLAEAVVLSNEGNVVARAALGVNAVQRAWWNGTSYSVLLHSLDSSDWGSERIAQVAADGSAAFSGAIGGGPYGEVWAWGRSGLCYASGCSSLIGTVEEGEYALMEERITPTGRLRGKSVVLAPGLGLRRNETMGGTLFRAPGGRLWAAIERRVSEVPFAGARRIFIVAMDPSRVRSVRR